MSNILLNKLKTIDTQRLDLENVLKLKGVHPIDTSLPGLISEVGKLQLYNKPEPDEWDGTVEEEVIPEDYYRGDDDWRSVINVDEIINNDTYDYVGKTLFIYRVSDLYAIGTGKNTWDNELLTAAGGGAAYRFSDMPDGTATNAWHNWDETQDIIASNGEKFRWIIVYSNNDTTVYSNVICEAVICWQGNFRGICLQHANNTAIHQRWGTNYASGDDKYNGNLGPKEAPKYVEIREGVTVQIISMRVNNDEGLVYKNRTRTFICDGLVTGYVGLSRMPWLEYMRMSNLQSYPGRNGDRKDMNLGGYCKGENRRVYIELDSKATEEIDLPNIMFSKLNNTYLHVGTCWNFAGVNTGRDAIFDYEDETNNTTVVIDIALGGVGRIGTSTDENTTNTFYVKECDAVWDDAFAYYFYTSYLRIKLPSLHRGIGARAFRNCKRLFNSITITKPEEDEATYTIGEGAFNGSSIKSLNMYESNITSITSSTADIGVQEGWHKYQFFGTSLKSVTYPKNMTSVPARLFYRCYDLSYVLLPEKLVTIGANAFDSCLSLTSVTLGDKITTINDYAFSGCDNLESWSCTSPLITSMGQYALAYCPKLTSVTLPHSLTNLPNYLFIDDYALPQVTIPTNCVTLNRSAFQNCKSLIKLHNTSQVQKLGQDCFNGCYELTYDGLGLDLNAVTCTESGESYRQSIFNGAPKLIIPLTKYWCKLSLYSPIDWGTLTTSDVASYNYPIQQADLSVPAVIYFLKTIPVQAVANPYWYSPKDYRTNTSFYDLYLRNNRYIHVYEDGEIEYHTEQQDGDITIKQYLADRNITFNG